MTLRSTLLGICRRISRSKSADRSTKRTPIFYGRSCSTSWKSRRVAGRLSKAGPSKRRYRQGIAISFQPQARSRLGRSPRAALRAFVYDTVVYDAEVLRELAGFASADRIVLGSDHPFEMAEPDPIGLARAAGLDPAALGANAARVFGFDG